MLEGLLGRRPRLTAYFGVLAAGLAMLVVGVEATRMRLFGSLGPAASVGYAGVGVLGAAVLAFVVCYLNGSLVAGWLVGSVPAAGRYGAQYLTGTAADPVTALLGVLGAALVVGTGGFVVATEKHRRDTRSADVPTPASRATVVVLAAPSLLAGVACLGAVVVM